MSPRFVCIRMAAANSRCLGSTWTRKQTPSRILARVCFLVQIDWINRKRDKTDSSFLKERCFNHHHSLDFHHQHQQFVVSKVNYCHRHHNLWCPSGNLSSAPNISTGAEIVGVWKTKSCLEDFMLVPNKIWHTILVYSSPSNREYSYSSSFLCL